MFEIEKLTFCLVDGMEHFVLLFGRLFAQTADVTNLQREDRLSTSTVHSVFDGAPYFRYAGFW